jgi:hypothetical protein
MNALELRSSFNHSLDGRCDTKTDDGGDDEHGVAETSLMVLLLSEQRHPPPHAPTLKDRADFQSGFSQIALARRPLRRDQTQASMHPNL